METKTVRISTTIDHITPAVPEDAMMGQNTLLRCQREPLKDVQQHCSAAPRFEEAAHDSEPRLCSAAKASADSVFVRPGWSI
jgi:hypothetical protein